MKICPHCAVAQPDAFTHCPHDGTALRPSVDPLVGRTIASRYRIRSRLGHGGMSKVYLAESTSGALVAVKTLRRDLSGDPVQRDRFFREARAVNRVRHPNVVRVEDYGETEDGVLYLVAEYVPGRSLLELMRAGPITSSRALSIAEQVARGLEATHATGVVHRDLKPENVLLAESEGSEDVVKLVDFGIAKILDAPGLTGSQQIFGTPGYIAPEYIQSIYIDGRADIYSLGVILYEMVTGALPFDYEYPGDLLVKHVTDPPVPPRARRAAVEDAVEAVILRCLRKDPAQRFRSASALIDGLVDARRALSDSWADLPSGFDGPRRARPTP